MILINKYEPLLSLTDSFSICVKEYSELCKIFDFIDLPEPIKNIEKVNSAILRAYYANALDQNLVDIKTVKYLINKNLKASNLSEKAIEQFSQAELFLSQQVHQPLSVPLVYEVHKILNNESKPAIEETNLFSHSEFNGVQKLDIESEIELENLFEFLNYDNEFHPILQSWILHFRLRSIALFKEGNSKIASLLQQFWLKKNAFDLDGLLSIEHELFLNKAEYEDIVNMSIVGENNSLNAQIEFGIQLHLAQIDRLRDLFRSYFRKQVDFEKLNPRQKNIMNYVFERGYKLKEIDESILNKRQKLIMYIVQHRGFISTKDLVNEFDCNRKTIQRDFQLMMDLGLVKSIGAGAGLRYCINLQEKRNPQLEKFQADFIRSNNSDITSNYEENL